jgi:hypothetical protein
MITAWRFALLALTYPQYFANRDRRISHRYSDKDSRHCGWNSGKPSLSVTMFRKGNSAQIGTGASLIGIRTKDSQIGTGASLIGIRTKDSQIGTGASLMINANHRK